ncbi:MAG: hypothetical protein NXI20_01230 [bacterium]|nr:hypothetical protein [bacterium]
MKRIAIILLAVICSYSAIAHVGSPGVVFEGKAGPYSVLVSVNPPDVIPGIAEISIYVTGQGVELVEATPIYWWEGDEGSPKADVMLPNPEAAGNYTGEVWFMSSGTASIEVSVKGSEGEGTTIVPVMASATAQNEMDASLGWLLAGLGLLLVILMATIIGSSVSDGLVTPGEELPKNINRKRAIGVISALVVLGGILMGGKAWWDSEADSYNRFMYRPPEANSWVEKQGDQNVMTFQFDTLTISKNRLPMGYMVPDHGKLMHMFMVRDETLDVFAHLHPKRIDPNTFQVVMPDVPAGKYIVYGDIVRLNGYVETISDTLEFDPAKIASQMDSSTLQPDLDDTYIVSNSFGSEKKEIPGMPNILICGKPGIETPLPDGSVAVWEHEANKSFVAGKLYPLTFAINDSTGNPANLEPYMGMMGHAVIYRKEGGVYVHLHPVGNYSMASQGILENRNDENTARPAVPDQQVFMDSVDQVVAKIAAMSEEERNDFLMEGMDHLGLGEHEEHGATVTFPYAFPQPGNYRIWIQMKKDGKVLNSSFDAEVIL